MEITKVKSPLQVFEELESEVRSYSRSFPTLFTKAKGYKLWDYTGKEYIDFFAGAGALNYGHNEERMKKILIDYIQQDGITHSLDMATVAKQHFLETFHEHILKPRHLQYKIMFPGPTGTNAVESALKLARKVTGRETVISFTNAFHGMTIGSLAVTGNAFKRRGAGIPLTHSVSMPYDRYFEDDYNTINYLEQYLEDNGSGLDRPAAIILETVQGEGGINAARMDWLRKIERLCRKWEIVLIVDDIQAGCGRTGTFFSFEPAGITPDIVCLSKSVGGYGLPLSLTLFKPEYDVWAPGEHNGTFRGNNLAFVAATEAIKLYWKTNQFENEIQEKSKQVVDFLDTLVDQYPEIVVERRGRGLMLGLACPKQGVAEGICKAAFEQGVIMETSGPNDEVVRLLPPLTIDRSGLEKGLSILEASIRKIEH